MCSNPNFRAIREFDNPSTGRTWTPLELLVDAFESGEVQRAAAAPTARISDHGHVSQWPDAPFIQPLTSLNPPSTSARPLARAAD
jgi:hypothetical protein